MIQKKKKAYFHIQALNPRCMITKNHDIIAWGSVNCVANIYEREREGASAL